MPRHSGSQSVRFEALLLATLAVVASLLVGAISTEPAFAASKTVVLGSLSPTRWTVNTGGYTGAIAVSGGVGPYALEAQSGLPSGLTAVLNGCTVSFSGTPTAVGTFSSVSITVNDSNSDEVTRTYSITIES